MLQIKAELSGFGLGLIQNMTILLEKNKREQSAVMSVESEKNKMKKTQPFYLDNKYIGEIPITGDQRKDIENAQNLLKEKGLNKNKNELDSMFQQATTFGNLALEIWGRERQKGA